MELRVYIPSNYLEERTYVIDLFFINFLGVPHEIVIGDFKDYIIEFSNKRIIIADDFFCHYKNEGTYFYLHALPSIRRGYNQFSIEDDVIILYGNNKCNIKDNEIYCGVDIFAGAFFMLTRWEEYVNKKRDRHGRFEGKNSIAFKEGFLHRPIVNEYVEMLWNMMRFLQFKGHRKNNFFQIVPTHDIDHFRMQHRIIKTIKKTLGDFARLKIRPGLFKIKWLYSDPFDTISVLASISEHNGLKSHFYFMSSSPKIDKFATNPYLYKKIFKNTICRLLNKGHFIGFHPGYFTFHDLSQLTYEKKELEKVLNSNVNEARYHFLRIDVPKSITLLEKTGISKDSSLGYADVEGFRCGTGNSFLFFDIIERRKTTIEEMPLIIMDGTLFGYEKYTLEQAVNTLNKFAQTCRKYKMPLTILFHNSSFSSEKGHFLLQEYDNFLKNNKF